MNDKNDGFYAFSGIIEKCMQDAFSFLSRDKQKATCIRLHESEQREFEREVSIIMLYVGDPPGRIILSTNSGTAKALVKAFLPTEDFTEDKARELEKDCLGEMTNVLASKIARYISFSKNLRVTTPSIVFGKNLKIEPCFGTEVEVCLDSPAGMLEVVLSFEGGSNGQSAGSR